MRIQHPSLAAAALVALAACGSDSSGPKVGPAAQIDVVSSPAAKGAVTTSVGTFSVKVSDANGRPVSGANVSFTVQSGGGGIVLAPSSASTDASGIAATTVTLGTRTGAVIVSATVAGLGKRVDALVTSTPGPLATIVSNPDAIKLWNVGDTARITSLLEDEFKNAVTDFVPAFTVADPTLVSVDETGLVRALRKGGTTMIMVTASGRSDSVAVRVAAVGESPCTGSATSTPLAVGDVVTASAADFCVTGDASAAADYAVVAYNTSTDGSSSLYATIKAIGVSTPPSASRVPTPSALRASRAAVPNGTTPAAARPALDESFHLKLLDDARKSSSRYRASRAEYDARLSRTSTSAGGLTPKVNLSRIPAGAAVGDLVTLNVSEASCDSEVMHGFRVAAVGAKSIVLADTLNPANGFSAQDYARFAARFDTLVYPLDVGAFGAPSDLDQNGKVAILFTVAVNELTPASSSFFVGGFFHPRDIFLKTGTGGCPTSNEGEMFYMLVPDPTGSVNGNAHSLGFVDTLTTSVLAHEFQHLINATRRLYVNSGFLGFEETWLNEGLSHAAEELLYFREAQIQPRENLGDAGIHTDPTRYQLWKANEGSNFSRFLDYVVDPGAASPLDDDDTGSSLATRGAAWAFLRYAVDRFFPNDPSVWARFTNTQSSGLQTLNDALLTDPLPVLADFAVANYVDDLGISTDPRYLHQSWNFRDIYSKTFGSRATGVFVPLGYYPILLRGVSDNSTAGATVRGSSAAYFRLSVGAGQEALLSFGAGSGVPSTRLKFIVVRTR
jgi:hypothetical protein